jgi:hypothetical protein
LGGTVSLSRAAHVCSNLLSTTRAEVGTESLVCTLKLRRACLLACGWLRLPGIIRIAAFHPTLSGRYSMSRDRFLRLRLRAKASFTRFLSPGLR